MHVELLGLVQASVGLDEAASVQRLIATAGHESELVQAALLFLALGPLASSFGRTLSWLRLERQRLHLQERAERRAAATPSLLEAIEWPPQPAWVKDMPVIDRVRDPVLENVRGGSGTFFSTKMHRHIVYESRIEEAFYRRLEECPGVHRYQEQPFIVPYTLDCIPRDYIPDVFVWLSNERGAVIELKPLRDFALHENVVKWQALRAFCTSRGYGVLVTDGTRTTESLKKRHVPYSFREEFHEAVCRGPLPWFTCKRLVEKHQVTSLDVAAVVLQHGFVWGLHPFEVKVRADTES